MKYITLIVALFAVAEAFAPASQGRVTSSLAAQKETKPLFRRIFEMDLFAPVADQNDYGARNKKNVSISELWFGRRK